MDGACRELFENTNEICVVSFFVLDFLRFPLTHTAGFQPRTSFGCFLTGILDLEPPKRGATGGVPRVTAARDPGLLTVVFYDELYCF